jgi:Holliday junction resolvase RusA-like endonuclease
MILKQIKHHFKQKNHENRDEITEQNDFSLHDGRQKNNGTGSPESIWMPSACKQDQRFTKQRIYHSETDDKNRIGKTRYAILDMKVTEIHLPVKPLSVNQVWQGKRYKTFEYKRYEVKLFMALPPKVVIPEMIRIEFIFGFSSKASDLDNPVKPLLDILQKKYAFNDSHVWEMEIQKKIVPKGEEYMKINILPVLPFE